MSHRCAICGKGPQVGCSISHSHIRTKRRWLPNLQRVKAAGHKGAKVLRVCAKCIKAGKVTRAQRGSS
jgi:large subunit ribosomal protein L28